MIFKSDMDVELINTMGTDLSICASARVSTGLDMFDYGGDKNKGLINFLMRDRHGTPFEHNSITYRISAPLFVFYEFHRHRVGWSYNEESARYRVLDPVFYVPNGTRNLRQLGTPGKYSFEPGTDIQFAKTVEAHQSIAECAWHDYEDMLNAGVAREVARNVLPVSIYKTMYATCNLRSLFSFLSLRRTHPASTVPTFPLAEIAMVAETMEELAQPLFPMAFEAFNNNGRVAP